MALQAEDDAVGEEPISIPGVKYRNSLKPANTLTPWFWTLALVKAYLEDNSITQRVSTLTQVITATVSSARTLWHNHRAVAPS